MIPIVTTGKTASAPFAGWNLTAILRDLVRSWVSHHQRLAEAGISDR